MSEKAANVQLRTLKNFQKVLHTYCFIFFTQYVNKLHKSAVPAYKNCHL